MCFYCKGEMKDSTTAFTVQYGNYVIVIKNVPCVECCQCGETEISDSVMKKVEELVASAKKMVQQDYIIDYSSAA